MSDWYFGHRRSSCGWGLDFIIIFFMFKTGLRGKYRNKEKNYVLNDKRECGDHVNRD